jgi:hypothetical protein
VVTATADVPVVKLLVEDVSAPRGRWIVASSIQFK